MRKAVTPLILQCILAEVAAGKNLIQACEASDRPSWTSIYRHIAKDPALKIAYRQARAHALMRGSQP